MSFEPPKAAPIELATHVLRPPPGREVASLETYASIFRDLYLQAMRESPESFAEDYTHVSCRTPRYWQVLVKQHHGLMQIAFGISPSLMPAIWATAPAALQFDLIMDVGIPLGVAINHGPVSHEKSQPVPASTVGLNHLDSSRQQYYGGIVFHIAHMNEAVRKNLFEHLSMDRDKWILDNLRSANTGSPAKARFRANIKSGSHQETLSSFYSRPGWYKIGAQTWRASLLADGGEAAVKAAERRGDDMDESTAVVERIFTASQLEQQMEANRGPIGATRARL